MLLSVVTLEETNDPGLDMHWENREGLMRLTHNRPRPGLPAAGGPGPPPEDLSVAQEFDPPEPRAEPVVFAAKALAERLHDGLAARGLTCVRVQVRATWADGRENSRLWRHDGLLSAAASPTGSAGSSTAWPAGRPARPTSDTPEGGIAALRLVPDQVVRATGHQLALWGETLVSDRVARAAMRVQALLGHEAVLRPVLGGGRNVDDQVTPVPFGEKREPRLPAGRPWPGRVMGAAPGLVYPVAREADVTDDAGRPSPSAGAACCPAAPARLAVRGEPPRRVTGWAGPWPLSERWWDPAAARRRARFQLVTDDGRAWLAVVEDGRWLVEAGYWLGGLGQSAGLPGGSCSGGCPGGRQASRAQAADRAAPTPVAARAPRPGRGRALGRAALPLLLQLPRRRGHAPASWSPRRPGSGSRRWPSPTTTGCTAWSAVRRRPPRGRDRASAGTVFGAELSPGRCTAARTGVARPGRATPAGAGPRPRGLPAAVAGDQRRAAGRRREGPPGLRPRRLADAHDGHWVVLTGCRKGPVPAALAARRPGGGLAASWPR